MDYATLTASVDDITENTFSATDHAMFAKQTEQKIHQMVQFPALRKNATGTLTISNQYLAVPADYLYTHSVAVVLPSGKYVYLLTKDSNFIRDAYPNPTVEGVPKHYAQFDENCYIVGPTPDVAYPVEIHYGYTPESIVTAGTTWLGDNFDTALLNGCLVEAIRHMKGEEDLVAMYNKFYMEAVTLLKGLGDGKLRTDSYRTGQVANPVS